MKLRLHDNSLRLRLSQSEIARLRDTGKVEDLIVFQPGKELFYTIETGAAQETTATFENAKIRVTLPASVAMQWIEGDQTGIEASTGTLRLLIEKDFQCLHREPKPGEDAFPNPLAST
jgi:hypothetical protein